MNSYEFSCQHPTETRQAQSISHFHQLIEQQRIPLLKYVFEFPVRNHQTIPQVYFSNQKEELKKTLKIQKNTLNSAEIIYCASALVTERNLILVSTTTNNLKILLDPFYNVEPIFDAEGWRDAPIQKMGLSQLKAKVVAENTIRINKNLTPTHVIEEPVFFFGTPFDDNYSHFIWDTLPTLHNLFSMKSKNVKVLVTKGISAYKLEFLKAFGIDDRHLVYREPNEVVLCRQLYVSSSLSVNNRWITPSGLNFLQRLRKPCQQRVRRIFLDRQDDRRDVRVLLNEERLWQICERHQFERFTPGKMSLAEKQKIFSEAAIIVGQYGGGLQNHFLAHEDTTLVVLQSPTFIRSIFDFTAPFMKHHVVNVVGRSFINYKQPNNSSFWTDEVLFENTIRAVTTPDFPKLHTVLLTAQLQWLSLK